MSMPRMSAARAAASSGLCATFTPPALPRPPVLTCALTTTVPPPSRSAPARASSGVSATAASSTGTPCSANRWRAWYSNRSTVPRPRLRIRLSLGSCAGCRRLSSVVVGCRRGPPAPYVGSRSEPRPGVRRACHRVPRRRTALRAPPGAWLGGRHVLADPLHDRRRRGPGREDLGHAELLQLGDVGVRDDAAA